VKEEERGRERKNGGRSEEIRRGRQEKKK